MHFNRSNPGTRRQSCEEGTLSGFLHSALEIFVLKECLLALRSKLHDAGFFSNAIGRVLLLQAPLGYGFPTP